MIARLSPKGFEEIGRAKLIEPTHPYVRRRQLPNVLWSHAAYANRHIVIRNDKEIVRVFSLASPERRRSLMVASRSSLSAPPDLPPSPGYGGPPKLSRRRSHGLRPLSRADRSTGARSIVVISDLHMGIGRDASGEWHPTEDFRWAAEFAAISRRRSIEAGRAPSISS